MIGSTNILILLTFMAYFCHGQNANRGQELKCYECAAKQGNNTCANEFRKTVKVLGFDKRCRVMEMNGKVVSQGVVPKSLCTSRALNKVNHVQGVPERSIR